MTLDRYEKNQSPGGSRWLSRRFMTDLFSLLWIVAHHGIKEYSLSLHTSCWISVLKSQAQNLARKVNLLKAWVSFTSSLMLSAKLKNVISGPHNSIRHIVKAFFLLHKRFRASERGCNHTSMLDKNCLITHNGRLKHQQKRISDLHFDNQQCKHSLPIHYYAVIINNICG